MLENSFFGILKPYSVGLYMPGEIHPRIVPGQQYFTIDRVGASNQLVPVIDLNEVKKDLFDNCGRIVATEYVMKNKSRFLTDHPTIPVRGIHLLKAIVDYKITEMSQWMSTGVTERTLRGCFVDEIQEDLDIDTVMVVVQNTVTELYRFIDQDTWNHYFVLLKDFDLVIQKCADYRICDWYERRQSGEWK